MKKLFLNVLAIVLIAALSSCATDISTDTSKLQFEEVVEKLTSPKLISKYMMAHIHYTQGIQYNYSREHFYHWKTPEETFKDKYGFCYDLSAFALYCLTRNGYLNAKLLFVCWGTWGREHNTGHFVCMYEEGNKYYSIDNGEIKGPFKTLDQLVKSASRHRKVIRYRFFNYNEIPFHTIYKKMDIFCL